MPSKASTGAATTQTRSQHATKQAAKAPQGQQQLVSVPAAPHVAPSATTQLQLQLAQQMLAFATQQATLLQQALPFMLPVCQSKVTEKLNQVLASMHAKPVVEALKTSGLSELQAQKACLEYSARTGVSKLQTDAVKQWITEHADMAELSR